MAQRKLSRTFHNVDMWETADEAQRFIRDRCDVDQVTGCWNWNKATCPRGYPKAIKTWAGQRVNFYAHRLSYEAFNQNRLQGLEADHLCYNPRCVNPGHLEAVTQHENVLRAATRRRTLNVASVRCRKGHEVAVGKQQACVVCIEQRAARVAARMEKQKRRRSHAERKQSVNEWRARMRDLGILKSNERMAE